MIFQTSFNFNVFFSGLLQFQLVQRAIGLIWTLQLSGFQKINPYTTNASKYYLFFHLQSAKEKQHSCIGNRVLGVLSACVVYSKYVYTQWNVSILVLLQVAVIIITMIIWRCH